MIRRNLPIAALLLAAACAPDVPEQNRTKAEPAPIAQERPSPVKEKAESEPEAVITPKVQAALGETIVMAEWRRAENRADCAPLLLGTDADRGGKPRRAQMSGGWGIAFDTPSVRSAYGYGGAGALPEDRESHAAKVERLQKQWPSLRRWQERENLPAESFAGYGLNGAAPYPDSNPRGTGLHSGAYLRIPGQACLYNVWSRISRDHLETMLRELRLAPQ